MSDDLNAVVARRTTRRDDTGKVFGRVTVVEIRWTPKNVKCVARCECGVVWVTWLSSLRQGLTQSCGCIEKRGLKKGAAFFPDDPSKKKCPKCLQWLSVSEFYKSSNMPRGVGTYCKGCKGAIDREYRERNIKRLREYDNSRSAEKSDLQKKRSSSLSDLYVARIIRQRSSIRMETIPAELVELKRQHLLIHRATKGVRNE